MNGETLNRPACLAIRAWLVENKGTMAEIVEFTGYGMSTVEKVIRALRMAGEPEVRNVIRDRMGAPRRPTPSERALRRQSREEAREAREAAMEQAERMSHAAILQSALASRTLLEQVWGAQA